MGGDIRQELLRRAAEGNTSSFNGYLSTHLSELAPKDMKDAMGFAKLRHEPDRSVMLESLVNKYLDSGASPEEEHHVAKSQFNRLCQEKADYNVSAFISTHGEHLTPKDLKEGMGFAKLQHEPNRSVITESLVNTYLKSDASPEEKHQVAKTQFNRLCHEKPHYYVSAFITAHGEFLTPQDIKEAMGFAKLQQEPNRGVILEELGNQQFKHAPQTEVAPVNAKPKEKVIEAPNLSGHPSNEGLAVHAERKAGISELREQFGKHGTSILQSMLNAVGEKVAVDNVYGSKTDAALRRVCAKIGISPEELDLKHAPNEVTQKFLNYAQEKLGHQQEKPAHQQENKKTVKFAYEDMTGHESKIDNLPKPTVSNHAAKSNSAMIG